METGYQGTFERKVSTVHPCMLLFSGSVWLKKAFVMLLEVLKGVGFSGASILRVNRAASDLGMGIWKVRSGGFGRNLLQI